MSTIQRIALEILGALMLCAAAIAWWQIHDHNEQKIGAVKCLQATTIPKTQAIAENKTTEAAQVVDIKAVVKGYEYKVASMARANDDLAGRLSAALRQGGVPHPGSAACPDASQSGLSKGQSEAAERLARLNADVVAVLNACDANQVKTEDAAAIYNGVRARALAAAK